MDNNMINFNENTARLLGRTFYDSESGIVYFNWTCSGFEFQFTGAKVEGELISSAEHAGNVNEQAWVAVFINDGDEPVKRFALDNIKGWYTLFEAEKPDTYKVKVLKITEAQNGRAGVTRLKIQGNLHTELIVPKQHKIEFIGDSITCGYGNEAEKPEDGFKTYQENGWDAFAAKTARKLKADFNCISSSGIGIYSSYTDENKINDSLLMPMVYNYTDRFLEQSKGKSCNTAWDFKKYVPDLIVINLGTNDGSYVRYDESRKENFRKLYVDFLKQIREKNGDYPKILCTIGSIDTYLFDEITAAVEEYKLQTGDTKIDTMKFEVQIEADGIGGDFHPSTATHEKMSNKLCKKITEYMAW
jgi:lysophospholipase L1-like esterase